MVGGADLVSGPHVLEGEKSENDEDNDSSEIGEDKGAMGRPTTVEEPARMEEPVLPEDNFADHLCIG